MAEREVHNAQRRRFLKAAAATIVTGTALGTGAAFWVDGPDSAATVAVPTPRPTFPSAAAGSSPAVPTPAVVVGQETLGQLAAAQAENLRLQAELDAARRRLDGLETVVDGGQDARAALQDELAAALERIGVLSGLVALYDRIDDINLPDLLEEGASRIGSAVSELLDDVPQLDEGLAASRRALDQFESDIPLVDAGRRWLATHVSRVHAYYTVVETVLQEGVERLGPFLEMLGEWFQSVLKWLPFGMGRTAATIMAALTDLLAETPFTIAGARDNVQQPLDLWLDDSGGEMPLMTTLIRPIREQMLDSAESAVAKARHVHDTYVGQLDEPARAALAQHAALRRQIADYRSTHQL